jgi:hypothetical protein
MHRLFYWRALLAIMEQAAARPHNGSHSPFCCSAKHFETR